MRQGNNIKSLIKSFSYAFKGIAYCVKNERNMRIHICMTVLVSVFSYFYKVSEMEFIAIILCMGLVIGNEAINTAMETLTNLQSPSYNNLARIAKDVSAGAVLTSALVSIIVGIIIFLKPHRLIETIILIISNPVYIALFAVLIISSILYIFKGITSFKDKKTKIYHINNYKK